MTGLVYLTLAYLRLGSMVPRLGLEKEGRGGRGRGRGSEPEPKTEWMSRSAGKAKQVRWEVVQGKCRAA